MDRRLALVLSLFVIVMGLLAGCGQAGPNDPLASGKELDDARKDAYTPEQQKMRSGRRG